MLSKTNYPAVCVFCNGPLLGDMGIIRTDQLDNVVREKIIEFEFHGKLFRCHDKCLKAYMVAQRLKGVKV